MEKTINKTAIIGMGALGLLYGEHIVNALGKNSVSFILDDDRFQKYQEKTFTCNGKKLDLKMQKSSEKEIFDLVIVAVKYNSLKSAIQTMKNCIGENTIIISVLNGISSEQIIGAEYGMDKLLITVAQGMDAMRQDSNLVYTKKGLLFIGKPDFNHNPSLEAKAEENLKTLKTFFDKIQMPYQIEENIMYRLWAKWMLNVGINQTCAVFDTTYAVCTTPGKIMDTFVNAMKEVVELSKYEGINLRTTEVQNYIDIIKTLAPDGYPSMAQDRKAKRYSEVEMFAGTVIELAEKHKIEVPTNRFLYEEMKKIESTYKNSANPVHNFTIRKALLSDLPELLKIYERARQFMKENGNESQWGLPSEGKTCWPSEESIVQKIQNQIQYVCETQIDGNTIIAATFAYTFAIPEPAYASIFEGQWPDNSSDYGVIHCFAASGTVKGSATYCINWAVEKSKYLKIDTHPNNKPMRNLLTKLGFTYCGKVLMPEVQNDDILRVAYYKMI
ncbi:MAG: 2-dehydropantoate 2-reductase [Treponema sp.]|nr:2-dehydropantoate 2-reductase [Treponema sp.]